MAWETCIVLMEVLRRENHPPGNWHEELCLAAYRLSIFVQAQISYCVLNVSYNCRLVHGMSNESQVFHYIIWQHDYCTREESSHVNASDRLGNCHGINAVLHHGRYDTNRVFPIY